MQIVNSFENINSKEYKGIAVAIGNFDGVHQGHQVLLSKFAISCKTKRLLPVVLTFFPHPNIYFANKDIQILLTDRKNKYLKINELGIENVVELEFQKDLQQLSAKCFLERFIINEDRIKLIQLGHDFKLGAGKESAKDILNELVAGRNITIDAETPFLIDGEICSSSLIRRKIFESGDITEANNLLGHKYMVCGTVIRGRGIGTKELFSTMNIQVDKNRLIPKNGVYITRTKIKNKEYESITNVGTNPTVTNDMEVSVETHVFYYNENVYESEIEVVFEKRLRDEFKFKDVIELKGQIASDIKVCKSYFREMNGISLALLGKDISHSRSQEMYEKILCKSINYTLIDCKSEAEIPTLSKLSEKYHGLSITAPYKKYFINETQLSSPTLKSINCIHLNQEKQLSTNTDYYAVKKIIERYIEQGITIINILGDGAMGKLTSDVCLELKITPQTFSRKLDNLDSVRDFILKDEYKTLLINACSREFCFSLLDTENYHFWDMNYNLDHHTKLFKNTAIKYVDGSEMLELQAKNAVSFWNLNKT
jgi:riboflavin kinase/FMN adenylyltransferase